MTNEQITKLVEEKNVDLERGMAEQARNILGYIVTEQAKIKLAQKVIAGYRKQLAELTYEPLDATDFVGE